MPPAGFRSCLDCPITAPVSLQVSCLIELVQGGAAVAHHLWVLLFPIVWSSLQKEQQVRLVWSWCGGVMVWKGHRRTTCSVGQAIYKAGRGPAVTAPLF